MSESQRGRTPELVAAPFVRGMAVRCMVHARAGETPSALPIRRMPVWMRERERHSEGRHVDDPHDFGWTDEGLAEAFREDRERREVPRE